MKSTFISRENNNAKFSMEFSADEFENAIVDVYRKTKGKFAVDGFRKGKAPRRLIETRYGEGVFFEDAINQLFSESYETALDELGIEVIDRPAADFSEIEKGKGFTVTITVAASPEFEVKDYKGVEIEKVDAEVPEEAVDGELEILRRRNARMILAERPAKEGDTLLIDYTGFVDDVQFEGGTAERYLLKIGSNTFIPGFEEQLIGSSAGEEKDVTVTFPTEYHAEDLAGKEAVFQCKIHEIKEEELPELNDDFAKDVSEHDTLDELKKENRERLENAARLSAENRMRNDVIGKIRDAVDLEVPNVMVQDEISSMMSEFDQQLRYQGMTIDQYFAHTEKSQADFRNEMKEEAEKRVKTRMVLSKIAAREGIAVTEEEMADEMDSVARQYGLEPEKAKETFGREIISYIEKDLKMKKVIDLIYESAEFISPRQV